jgi:S1-C subfamily serine protease
MRRVAHLGIGMIVLIAAAAASAEPHRNWPNRGRLGMEVQSMTDALREFFAAPADRGVLVVRVLPDRAAAQAGVLVGDVLISAGGEAIEEPLELIAAVARVPAGGTLALELVRKGKTETIEVSPEGEPVEFSPPEHGDAGKHAHGEKAHADFHDEVLRRLQSIETRLEGIEKK